MATLKNSIKPNSEEHRFAKYVRILGKGKSGTRSLDIEEAYDAFSMILSDQVEPLQLGAFLMLLRVKEESAEELAGFVKASRDAMAVPPGGINVDLDWSSYAGKKHQHPWFILSIKLLTEAGYRVFIHGTDAPVAGRLLTSVACNQLGLPVANTWSDVAAQLDEHNLSFFALRHFCDPLHQMLLLRPLLGLRSPINTVTRILNPLQAPASLHSIFHPAYAALHQQADKLLQQQRAMVFKGDSGEVEIKPQANTRVLLLNNNESNEIKIPRCLDERVRSVEKAAITPIQNLWRGESTDAYGLAATLATTSAALLLLESDLDLTQASARAQSLWNDRNLQGL